MKTLWLVALLLLFGQSAHADTPPHYRMTVLPLSFLDEGTDDGYERTSINAQGQVTGMAAVRADNQSDKRAAFWQRGRLRFLDKAPVKGSDDGTNRDSSCATALNAHGDAIGQEVFAFSGAYSFCESTACGKVHGKWIGLAPFPVGSDSQALGVNAQGDIVGDFGAFYDSHFESLQDPPTPASKFARFAFLWQRGRVKKLWAGLARGINNKGEIIGTGRDGGLLWRNGKITLLKMRPTAINERTEIAGNISAGIEHRETAGRAYLWRRGTLTRLSAKISHAYALNNLGQVVGEIGDDSSQAVLWRRGRTYNLNRCVSLPKGWILEKALGINGKGWIIGEGSVYKSPKDIYAITSFTFLLTPR